MSLATLVPAYARRVVQLLDMPDPARGVLGLFGDLETDPGQLELHQSDDETQRRGVVSWQRLLLLAAAEQVPTQEMLDAIEALTQWGLLQIVGEQASDPKVPGTAALRLTHAGRVCIGLAPSGTRELEALPPPESAPSPWEIWHGSSREGLLFALEARFGPSAWRPLRLADLLAPGANPAGRIATVLSREGRLLLDSYGVPDDRVGPALEDLLCATSSARALRVVVAPSPAPIRVAAIASGARFHWVQIPLHGSQHIGFFDERVTERLLGAHTVEGSQRVAVCGMPESDLAIPRKVEVYWEDLLVPPATRHQLELAVEHARYRLELLPGQLSPGARPLGYRLLLSGLPGTGKTMAAEALASTMGRLVLRLDLSAILSKWLGETERFLSQIFEMAEVGGFVLVLDEAESLFRQRESGGEGGGEALKTIVSYLLVRLERYSGLLVATTNRTKDLDEAFFRRFDDFVVIPVPDEPTRLRLWYQMLRLDEARAEALGLDLSLLARRFPIPGGLIKGAALRAQAWAQGLRRALSMPVLLAALARELEKSDRASQEVFVEPYRAEVQLLLKGFAAPGT